MTSDRGAFAGRQLGGYQMLSLLGAGGMGEVYRARDVKLGREVALKVLARSTAGDPDYLQRFEEEARLASVLNHPNIVTIYGVGEAGDIAYIAMELVRGRTLRALLAERALRVGEVLDLAAPLADALAAATLGEAKYFVWETALVICRTSPEMCWMRSEIAQPCSASV